MKKRLIHPTPKTDEKNTHLRTHKRTDRSHTRTRIRAQNTQNIRTQTGTRIDRERLS